MVDKVTCDTPIKHLEVPIRVINALYNWYPRPEGKDLTVGDVVNATDAELLRMPNFGRISLRRFRKATQHLRKHEDTDEERDSGRDSETLEEYRALRNVRSTLNRAAGLHRQLAKIYNELGDIILPIGEK
jgi:hypothetical protein